jgi:hypothetical protein
METLEYRPGYDFGIGIDSVTGNPKGDAVIRSDIEDVTGAAGQSTNFFMRQIESTEELNEALSASASVSGRYGFFSGRASFEFARQAGFQRYSTFLLISTSVVNSFRQLRDVRLAPHAVRLWESGDKDAWLAAMGDSFCQGMSTGGLLNVVLRIDTENEEQQDEIATELQAGMNTGIAKFNAKAQFSQMVNRLASKTNITLSHMQMGGKVEIEYTPDRILERAAEFAESVKGNLAVPFSVNASDYRIVSNLPAVPNKFDRQLQKDVINACGRLRLRYLDQINDIEYVLNKSHQFDWKGRETAWAKDLDTKADALRNALSLIARRASECADNAVTCALPTGEETVVVPDDLLPDRRARKPGSGPRPKRARPRLQMLKLVGLDMRLAPSMSPRASGSAPRAKPQRAK